MGVRLANEESLFNNGEAYSFVGGNGAILSANALDLWEAG